MDNSSGYRITRYDNGLYSVNHHVNNQNINHTVRLPDYIRKTQVERRVLLSELVKYIPDHGNQSQYLVINNEVYRWDKSYNSGLAHRIATYISNFFKPQDKEVFDLVSVNLTEEEKTSFLRSEHVDIDKLMGQYENISPQEFEKGIFAKLDLSLYNPQNTERFDDPYSKLAALAFQQIEPQFAHETFSDCKTCLVEVDGHLTLQSEQNNPSNKATVQNYYDRLVKEHGKDKIDYIQHLYSIDFKAMIAQNLPLTAEHIYRMNIGAMNLEIQDVNEFYHHLEQLEQRLQSTDPSSRNVSLLYALSPPSEFAGILNGNEIRSLTKHINPENAAEPTIADFLQWMHDNQLNQKLPFDQLTSRQVEILVKSMSLDSDERERALTGRAILDPIIGIYQAGSLSTYKPWIDQQQLVQSFNDYENTNNWAAFYECLSFVTVKMHLVREHPTEGFRVGALIPTPLDANGEQHWYKVTSCVSNGQGVFSYTLEGLGEQPMLPPIKLYRSTTTSPYSMDASATLKNDINPFNSPGYLGKGLGDRYEEAFFKDRSIPVWVGYLCQAQELLRNADRTSPADCEQVVAALRQANKCLMEQQSKALALKSFSDILRDHDTALVDVLMVSSGYASLLPTLFAWQEETIPVFIDKLTKKYLHQALVESSDSKVDAEKLCRLLKDYVKQNPKLGDSKKAAIQKLLDDLDKNIINREKSLFKLKKASEGLKQSYSHLQTFDEQIKLSSQTVEEAFSKAEQCIIALEKEAKKNGEHPSQKKDEDVLFLGYSLGSSCAQVYMHHYFSECDRIPLKGHQAKLYSYDGTGINDSDNEKFKSFGNTHADLLESLSVTFSIEHSQEAGDFVPFGGEAHLGAEIDRDKCKEMKRWLKFSGAVYETTAHPQSPAIAYMTTAHETRFRVGKEGIDYTKKTYDAREQAVVDKGTSEEAIKLKKETWKIDYITGYLNELQRRRVNNTIYLAIAKSPDPLRGKAMTDGNGVFAVSEKGVVSSTIHDNQINTL